jgi:hypothetical protein
VIASGARVGSLVAEWTPASSRTQPRATQVADLARTRLGLEVEQPTDMTMKTIDNTSLEDVCGGAATPEQRKAGVSHLANTPWVTTGFGGLADAKLPGCFPEQCDFNSAGQLRYKNGRRFACRRSRPACDRDARGSADTFAYVTDELRVSVRLLASARPRRSPGLADVFWRDRALNQRAR